MSKYPEYQRFVRPKRKVHTVFLHYPAINNPDHDNIDTIAGWHIQDRGWSDIGYHYYINGDGVISCGRSLERIPAAQKNHNNNSIAVCAFGNEASLAALKCLCFDIDQAYGGEIQFKGHKEVAATLCPPYEYKKLLKLSPDGRILGGVPTEKKLIESGSRTLKNSKAVKDTANGITLISALAAVATGITWISDQLPIIQKGLSQILPYIKNASNLRDLLPVVAIIAALYLREKIKVIEKARLDDEQKVRRLDD